METATAVSDLERRKQVKVRLRGDLSITLQKYEGRTYYVVKDPVSLRYYRFKEQERFLLDQLDGETTLDEAQKSFEQRFRPERLPLEDLENFATQLLNAGLAQNESPQAGKQLFDRYKKRRRRTIASSLLNLMYIKIPLYDPDRLLSAMLPKLKFIFTTWFFFLSIGIMLAALGLVLVQWDTFVSKLPSAQEFFSFRTLVYLWIALGGVKIIHEFGHGLSCKAFGGEVHEMGALFLVFSPCLYCNVSDSWTLPNKWHRIIIGAAGIYVELIIASFATFIWWATDSGTFINNLCMSLIIVCSVSTVIFNANPLMRFDGYYILADWLEIPNLRDRSNRFLQSLIMEHCLGIETTPEPYMTRTRQFLFVFYAITSYVYRWVVTFGILYFMYTFLEPYRLGSLSFLLGTGAVATMVGWPAYRLGKAIHRRGRIPDMKPVRVWVTASVVLVLIALLLTIPFPVRVKALGMVQVKPGHVGKVVVPESGGFLREIRVKDGETVKAGDTLALLSSPELEMKLKINEKDLEFRRRQQGDLRKELSTAGARADRAASELMMADASARALEQELRELRKQSDRLTLRAPRDGTVMGLPRPEDVNKSFEKGTLICQIGDPNELQAVLLVEPHDLKLMANGDKAWIRVHGRGAAYFRGTITEISTVEAKEVPPALSNKAGGDIPTKQEPQNPNVEEPQHQHYTVAVDFDAPDEAIHPGALCRIKIEAQPRTLAWRFNRFMSSTFNWGLWFSL